MWLSKYWTIAKIGWQNGFVYRLNFIMWRVRMVLSLLIVYFLWWTISEQHPITFGYEQASILTYVLGTSLLRSLVISSQSINAQNEISSGDLNNYLVKPLNYFGYWLFRDFADKALNVFFSFGEIILLYLIFRPPVFLQSNPVIVLQFISISFLAMLMYYFFSLIISMTTFWWYEHNGWPQRFLIFTILESLAGGLFPLDILPSGIFNALKFLPTSHFIFTPLQVYLGRISASQLYESILIMTTWTCIMWLVAKLMWRQGLKIYGAFGR